MCTYRAFFFFNLNGFFLYSAGFPFARTTINNPCKDTIKRLLKHKMHSSPFDLKLTHRKKYAFENMILMSLI